MGRHFHPTKVIPQKQAYCIAYFCYKMIMFYASSKCFDNLQVVGHLYYCIFKLIGQNKNQTLNVDPTCSARWEFLKVGWHGFGQVTCSDYGTFVKLLGMVDISRSTRLQWKKNIYILSLWSIIHIHFFRRERCPWSAPYCQIRGHCNPNIILLGGHCSPNIILLSQYKNCKGEYTVTII